MCPKSFEYISERKIETWIKILCSSTACVQIENWQGQSTELYKTFAVSVVMQLLWFCSRAALCAVSHRGTGGTMGSQWHSKIRWRSQQRLHMSLAVTPLCGHLEKHTSKNKLQSSESCWECSRNNTRRVLVAEDIGHQCPKGKLLWKLLLKSNVTIAGFFRL